MPSSPTELPVPASPTSPVLPGEAADIPEEFDATVPMLRPVGLPRGSVLQEEQEQVATLPYELGAKRQRRGRSPASPLEIPVPRQPGTPTYTPTDDVYAPETPIQRAGALFGRPGVSSVGRSSAGRDTAGSSPTYIMEEVAEEPLPPTPTYTGSSPTYLDELEPPTPTLEADDDDLYGKEDEVVLGAFPGIRFMQPGAPGTPPQGTGTPVGSSSASTNWVRLPGLESPTPTYEPDDEDFYGTGSSGSGPAPPPTPPPPLPGTGARTMKRPLAGTPPGTPQSRGLPGTPQSVPVQPGTPQSQTGAGPGTPLSQGGTATPTRVTAAAASSSAGAAYDPFAAPGSASGAAASSGEPAVPPLASEVFGERAGKRKSATAPTGGEELPPWKRRERRRKQ